MQKPSAVAQYRTIVSQGIRVELSDPERLISPVLFAITILLLFSFAIGQVDPSLRQRIFTAEIFLTVFFALQISFSRIFEPDRQDRVFDVLRTTPVSYAAWFLAKYTLVILIGALTLVPTLLVGTLLSGADPGTFLSLPVIAITAGSLTGLSALGIILSALTMKSSARHILYPILYFPLTAPVLLASCQATLIYLEAGKITESFQSWAGLLAGFDIIYFTLGILLFSELVDDT